MSGEPQLFRVDPQSRESERIEEVDFASWDSKNGGISRSG